MGAIHHTTVIAYYPDNLPNTIAGLGTLCYTIDGLWKLNDNVIKETLWGRRPENAHIRDKGIRPRFRHNAGHSESCALRLRL